jgi:uncharacterized membrane protein AbrB (regulator of aidB expression)
MNKELSFIMIPAIVAGMILGLRAEEAGYPSWVGGAIGVVIGGKFGMSLWSVIEKRRSRKKN